ncbi:MAG: hypothetical protein WA865_17215 [Spirulinaceae cyanobacterium]
MSQDASKNQLSATNQTWSAETDADKLMNDLFSDIDRILEGGSKLPTQTAQPDYVSLQNIVVPAASLPPALRESSELLEQLSEDTGKTEVLTPEEEKARSPRRQVTVVEKALFGTACASLVAVVAWLFIQNKLRIPFFANGSKEITQVSSVQDEDPFARYMKQSLDAIESQAKAAQGANGAVPPGVPPSVPPYPLPSSFPVAPQGQKTLERVYIPVFPPNQNPSAGAALRANPQVSPSPQSSSQSSQPAAKPASKPATTTQPAAKPVPKPSPSASTPPQPSPTTPDSTEAPANAATATAPLANHTLVGILELGDRSAGLFKIDGVTQRIMLGEDIGSSGWKLVSVINEKATIRRNGEVRSIYAGQSF